MNNGLKQKWLGAGLLIVITFPIILSAKDKTGVIEDTRHPKSINKKKQPDIRAASIALA